MNYLPLGDKIIFKPISSEQVFNGLVIPDSSTPLRKGVIVAIHPNGCKAEIGQTILYRNDDNDGMPFAVEDEQYIVMSERYAWMVGKLRYIPAK